MHEATLIVTDTHMPLEAHFDAITRAAAALVPPATDRIAAMANLASLLYHSLPDINWCGFYRAVGDRLIVGPFQGKPACNEIPIGKGVCGRAAAQRRTLIVTDVTAYPGHIACDPASRSEIVIPLIERNAVVGVLDLDSPVAERFTDREATFLENIVHLLLERTVP